MRNVKKNETMRLFAPFQPADNNFTLTNHTADIIARLQQEDPSLEENQFMGHLLQLFLDYTKAVLQQDQAALAALLTADFARVHQAPPLFSQPNVTFAYLNSYQEGSLILILVTDNGQDNPLTKEEQRYFIDFVKDREDWKLDDLQLLDYSIGIDE